MTAQEEKDQRVVGGGYVVAHNLDCRRYLTASTCALTTDLVDDPPRCNGHQPAARIIRYSLGQPLHARTENRLRAALSPALSDSRTAGLMCILIRNCIVCSLSAGSPWGSSSPLGRRRDRHLDIVRKDPRQGLCRIRTFPCRRCQDHLDRSDYRRNI